MKFEGYTSNVWFTVVFGTPLLIYVYAVITHFYGFELSWTSLISWLALEALSLLVCLPAAILHTVLYKKISGTNRSTWQKKMILFGVAALLLTACFFVVELLSEVSGYLLSPFTLLVIRLFYAAVLTVSSFLYRIEA